jgi:hypothetical protein
MSGWPAKLKESHFCRTLNITLVVPIGKRDVDANPARDPFALFKLDIVICHDNMGKQGLDFIDRKNCPGLIAKSDGYFRDDKLHTPRLTTCVSLSGTGRDSDECACGNSHSAGKCE